MIELAVWHEIGLSSVDEAEVRYRQILGDENPIPASELNVQLQEFVHLVRRQIPDVKIAQFGYIDSGPPLYSRYGITLEIDIGSPKDTYSMVLGTALNLKMSVYDPELKFIMGEERTSDIVIYE